MFMSLSSNSQDTAAYKQSRSENKFIYQQHTIKIFAGQRICLQTSNDFGKLEGMKVFDSSKTSVTKGENSASLTVVDQNEEKSLCIDFSVKKSSDGKTTTFLIVNNPFKGMLTYKAKIYSKLTNNYEETSIGFLLQGISGVESWPFELMDIILYDFGVAK
jgi:hypothetical protein